MSMEVIYNTYHTNHGPVWDWRVAADLFFGGAGVGAFLFAVGIDEWFRGKYRRICRTGAYLAPALILIGLLLLLLKLGRPLNGIQTVLNVNMASPLWWGSIFQPMLVAGCILYAFMWYRESEDAPGVKRRWFGRLLTPLAIIVGTYHGLVLAVNVTHPLWNTGPAVVAAMFGFASTGIAAVMFVHLIRMKIAGRLDDAEHLASFLDNMRVVRNVLVAVIVLQLGTFVLWWLSLKYGTLADQQALAAANAEYGPMFWWLGIGLGLIVPLVIGAIVVIRGEAAHRRTQVAAILVTSALIFCGGFFFRLAVVLGGQVDLPIRTLS